MERFLLFVGMLVVLAFPLAAQKADLHFLSRAGTSQIEFRLQAQMSQQDRNLADSAKSAIREKAGFADFGFNQSHWNYQQLLCPALPNHLFLRFTRNNGARDVSIFSASIPRGIQGQLRIIPILRRSYSSFSPAPIHAQTIAAFNRIRAEDHAGESPDWLGTALCYAALAGADPQAASLQQSSAKNGLPAAPLAVMELPIAGGAEIHFTDVAATPKPMEWTLIFNGKGKLLKTTRQPASLVRERPLHPTPVNEQGKPMLDAPVDLKGKPIQ
jgi:hypothetical protein